ncbi:MAG: SLC13 family permease [Gammaproteobacteria bacterium]|jgi:di/tricarboxylate transporter
MTYEQLILFTLLALVFVFLVWGRWRYDLVAFAALCLALVTGVVPAEEAFSGFGHHATVIVALVLIVSRALSNSGVIEWIGRVAVSASRSLMLHVGVMGSIAAALSAVMNNVAALALLMPVDLQAAKKAGRGPAASLMPLSFASILGGMITLIGTPPNIIIAAYRDDALGEAYSMFDFAPVGLACTVAGLIFVTFIGWRLIPPARRMSDSEASAFELDDFVFEVQVGEKSPIVGQRVRDLDDSFEHHGVAIVGLIRQRERMPGMARTVVVRAGDLLVLEGSSEDIDATVGAQKLEYVRQLDARRTRTSDDDDENGSGAEHEELTLQEVVVPSGARIEHRSAIRLGLLARHEVTLVGISRQGRRFRESVRRLPIEAGDILLLLGTADRVSNAIAWLGCLPLAERGLKVLQRQKALTTIIVFAAAVFIASLGLLDLAVALAAAVTVLVAVRVVSLSELYESVEWPVVVLLGSMIPLGAALETTGGTQLIADGIVGLSAGFSPVVVLAALMVVTMSLSDVMNNTATAVIAAPVATQIAATLDVSPDPFLMAVAVAASCAFLTPIGHKNNTLIMGPGGYHFGDYWRMGLPLEVLIIVVSIPTILTVWPM